MYGPESGEEYKYKNENKKSKFFFRPEVGSMIGLRNIRGNSLTPA